MKYWPFFWQIHTWIQYWGHEYIVKYKKIQYANRTSRQCTKLHCYGRHMDKNIISHLYSKQFAVECPRWCNFKRNVTKKLFPTKMQMFCKGEGRSVIKTHKNETRSQPPTSAPAQFWYHIKPTLPELSRQAWDSISLPASL